MIEAMRTRSGKACLMRRMRGSHQSSVLSEMSSQFHDECSAAPGRFFIETEESSGDVRMNLALAPTTLVTGWSPIVFVTTPAHPASKARRMLLSDSVGGAEESRKGFSNSRPVKWTDRLADMADDLHYDLWSHGYLAEVYPESFAEFTLSPSLRSGQASRCSRPSRPSGPVTRLIRSSSYRRPSAAAPAAGAGGSRDREDGRPGGAD